jgi:hypothetical protein
MTVKTVTQEELKANKQYGWYVNPGGVVYQVLTISPRKVKYIGRLEAQATPAPKTTKEEQ